MHCSRIHLYSVWDRKKCFLTGCLRSLLCQTRNFRPKRLPSALLLEISYEEIRKDPAKLRFFTRKEADGSICPFDAKTIEVSGLPAGISAEKIDFAAYPGDNIEFGINGIGILGRSYGEKLS